MLKDANLRGSVKSIEESIHAVLKAELARFLGYEKHSSGAKSTCRFVGKHHHPTVPTLCQYERHHQFVWRNSQPAKQLHNPMATLHQCRSSGASSYRSCCPYYEIRRPCKRCGQVPRSVRLDLHQVQPASCS